MGTPQLYRTPLGWTRKSQPVWSDISVWPPKCFSALTDNNPTDRLQHVQKLPRRVQRGTNSRLMPGSCCLYNVYIMCRSRWSLFKTFFSPPTNTYKQQRMYRLTVALVHTNTPFQLNLTLVLGYRRCSSKCYKRRFLLIMYLHLSVSYFCIGLSSTLTISSVLAGMFLKTSAFSLRNMWGPSRSWSFLIWSSLEMSANSSRKPSRLLQREREENLS